MLLLCVGWQAIVVQRGKMLLLCVEWQVKVGKNRTTRTDREEPNPVCATKPPACVLITLGAYLMLQSYDTVSSRP